mgnify:CR=1 FL=1
MPCGYCKEEGHNRATCPQLSGMSIEARRLATRNAQSIRNREQAERREAERRRNSILLSQQYRQREEQRREQARQRQEQIERQEREARERREKTSKERFRIPITKERRSTENRSRKESS